MDNPSFTSLNDWGTHKKKCFVTFLRRKKKGKTLDLIFFFLFFLFFLLKIYQKQNKKLLPGGRRLLPNQSESTLIDERSTQHFCVFFLFLYTIVIITMIPPQPSPALLPYLLNSVPYLHISVIFMNDTQNAHLNRGEGEGKY